jgi:hypothetical protein
MNFLRRRELSAAAADLIRFDEDSIGRVGSPDVWVVDPDGYEKNGRLLRDTESPRMLAYSTKDRMLYATDGCNSCARPVDLNSLSTDSLRHFAAENEFRLDLLECLRSLL